MTPDKAACEELPLEEARYAPVTLVFLIRKRKLWRNPARVRILLGKKKKGFGSGKYVGIGGHVEEGETFVQAAVREVQEEILVTPTQLCYRGWVDFIFPSFPERNMTAVLYTCRRWEGTIAETAEIKPRWFRADGLPYRLMWHDSVTWVSRILRGEKIHATIIMADDNEHVTSSAIAAL